jgi:hypothetical protein
MSRMREPTASQTAASEADAEPARVSDIEKTIMMFDSSDDAQHLATMLVQRPGDRAEILAAAHKHMGNDVIVRALAMIETPKAEEQQPAPAPKAELRAFPKLVDDTLAMLEPQNVDVLVKLFHKHPGQRELLITQATEIVGPDAVRAALAIVDQESPKAAVLPQEAPPPGVEAAPAPTAAPQQVEEPTPALVVEKQVEDKVATAPEKAAPSEAPAQAEPAQEKPGWVTRAIAYNAAHETEVGQFNVATGNCCVGSDGVVDPYLVAAWQAKHDVAPDGRVGRKTLENAWLTEHTDLSKAVPSVTRPDDGVA